MSRRNVEPSVARLAAALLEALDPLTEELADRITAQIEIYKVQTLVSRAELKRSLTQNLAHILGQLSSEKQADLDAPRQIGRARAAHDVPLPEILRAYRLGFTFVWQQLLDAAERAGQPAMNALLATATTIWELADDYSLAMTEAYRERMSERMISADRRRSGLVAALLDGPRTADRGAWEIAKLLDLPFEGRFLVVVVEAPNDVDSPARTLDGRLRSLDVNSAWRTQPDYEIGVLSLGPRRPAPDILAALADTPGTRIGVSPVYTRLDGTGRALRFAHVALEGLPAESRGVRQLDDLPLTDLLIHDRESTRRFVVRVLGNVLALPDNDRSTLIATAEAWIAARGSAPEAGRVLYCHENTVRHRMHRLEEHLGLALDDPRNLTDLTAALQAIRTFPDLAQQTPNRPATA